MERAGIVNYSCFPLFLGVLYIFNHAGFIVVTDSGTVEILSENFNLTNSTRRFFMDPNSGDQISILITFPQYHLSKSDVQVMKPNGDVINSTATLPDVYRSVLAFDLIEIDSEVMVSLGY